MKVLALDFDGVVSNSIWDSMFTGFNVYLKRNPHTKIFNGVAFTFENYKKIFSENKELCSQYKRLVTFCYSGKHFVMVFNIIEKHIDIVTQKDFDRYCNTFSHDDLISLQDEFYQERHRLQAVDFDRWYDLSPPFEAIIPDLRRLLANSKVIIVTNKDRDTVIKLTKKYGMDIPMADIYDKDLGLEKVAKLDSLSSNYNKENIVFVDDLFTHCIQVKKAGYLCFMAAWGYNTKDQQKLAEKDQIVLLTQDNFYEKLKEALK
ncbi:MAG: hypothetical protein ABIC04_04205 [Nanoarchaeota archaeon]